LGYGFWRNNHSCPKFNSNSFASIGDEYCYSNTDSNSFASIGDEYCYSNTDSNSFASIGN
jgi:hypothetical protein